MDVNWIAVISAAMSSFVLGALWYGPIFGKAWLNAAGVSEAELRAGSMPLIFGSALVLSLIAAASFAVFLGPEVNATTGAIYGATAGVCWVATSFGTNYLFERKSVRLFCINGGYHAVQFSLIGLILGAWR